MNDNHRNDIIIKTDGLTREFRRFEKEPGIRGSLKSLVHRNYLYKTALSDFNLTVSKGEFTGLIGPNGAGKTTLVKLLTGIIAPSAGHVQVLGFAPNKLENAFKKQYAVVMGQKSQLFFELSPSDTFLLFKELYGIPEVQYRNNLDYLIHLFQIEDLLNVQVRTLSLGERMKMELITALLHEPAILFLDEPTIGLDAIAQRQIRSFLKQINEEKGTTILMTSHYMEDIKSLCRRCIVINQGCKLYDGSTDALFDRYRTHKRITLHFAEPTSFQPPAGCPVVEQDSMKCIFTIPAADAQLCAETLMRSHSLTDINIEEDDIGSIVERIYSSGKETYA